MYPQIDRAFSLVGFETDDGLMVAVLLWIVMAVMKQANVHLGRFEMTIELTIAGTLVLFALWRAVKVGRPRHFLEDCLDWLAEPDCWDVTPDWKIRPAYVMERSRRVTIEPTQTKPSALAATFA